MVRFSPSPKILGLCGQKVSVQFEKPDRKQRSPPSSTCVLVRSRWTGRCPLHREAACSPAPTNQCQPHWETPSQKSQDRVEAELPVISHIDSNTPAGRTDSKPALERRVWCFHVEEGCKALPTPRAVKSPWKHIRRATGHPRQI